MKVYRNKDGSYDIVNTHSVLFKVYPAVKCVGRKPDSWQPKSEALQRIPSAVMTFINTIEETKL
jgi:hypothetical protein